MNKYNGIIVFSAVMSAACSFAAAGGKLTPQERAKLDARAEQIMKATPQKYYVAPLVDEAPVIDGDLADPIWKQAAWSGDYKVIRTAEAPLEPTRFKAVYTKDAVYLAIENTESDPEKNLHPEWNDAEWWYCDIAEVFFMPAKDELIHVIQTSRNHRYEDIPGEVHVRTKGDVAWEAKAKIGRKSWTVEFKVPFRLLGIDPGDRYATVPFNLMRCISRDKQFSCWNFCRYMRNSDAFGRLAFGGRKPQVTPPTGSEVTFSCWAKVTELAKKDAPRGRGAYAFLCWPGIFRMTIGANGGFESEFDAKGTDGKPAQFITRFDANKFFEPGEWMHYAATYSLEKGETAIYVNGQQLHRRTDDLRHTTKLLPLPAFGKNALIVGALGGGWFPADGEITGVKCFDRALSADELVAEEAEMVKRIEPTAKDLRNLLAAREARRLAERDRLFENGRELRYSVVDPWARQLYGWNTALPEDTLDKPLRIVSALGEHDGAAFIVRSKNSVKGFLPTVSELKTKDGDTLPASTLDLYVNKVLVRPWSSARILEPSVLVHDDALVTVDAEKMENLMRYDFPEGPKTVNVSVPKPALGGQKAKLWVKDHPIHDAKTLQPMELRDHTTVMFWAKTFVPKNAKPGLYRGEIALRTTGGESFGTVPVELRVLGFELPEAKTYYDPSRVFERAIYHRGGGTDMDWSPDAEGTIGQRMRSEAQVRAEMRDMAEHGIQHACICMGLPMPFWQGRPSCYNPKDGGSIRMPTEEEAKIFDRYIAMLREEGLVTDPLYVFNTGNLGFRDHYDRKTMKPVLEELCRKLFAYLKEHLGHTNVLFYGVDEAQGQALLNEYDFWEDFKALGGRSYTTSMNCHVKDVAGRIELDSASHTYQKEHADLMHKAGGRIWSYANPQAKMLGQTYVHRVNYGFALWKGEFDGFGVYAYNESNYHPWNFWDGDEWSYVLQNADGVNDCPSFEALREATDDVRYATLLRELIAKNPSNPVAAEAKKYIEQELDPYHPAFDPSKARAKIIGYILKFRHRNAAGF